MNDQLIRCTKGTMTIYQQLLNNKVLVIDTAPYFPIDPQEVPKKLGKSRPRAGVFEDIRYKKKKFPKRFLV